MNYRKRMGLRRRRPLRVSGGLLYGALSVSKACDVTLGPLKLLSTDNSGCVTVGSEADVSAVSGVVHGVTRSTWTVWKRWLTECWISITSGEKNFLIIHGPVQRLVSLHFLWRTRGLGQNNQTFWPIPKFTLFTLRSKYVFSVRALRRSASRTRLWASWRVSLKSPA